MLKISKFSVPFASLLRYRCFSSLNIVDSESQKLRSLNVNLKKLGTETAYAVAMEAAALKAQGKTVYPFHIGDLNFKTPKVVVDALKTAVDEGKTGYPPAAGVPDLRNAIAGYVSKTRGVDYKMENVVVQPGGKPVIQKFLSTCMNEGDENPNGAVSTPQEMKEIAKLALDHNLWVMSDEAYYDVRYGEDPPVSIVSLPGMAERTAILFTFSKSWSMTGWRLGAAIGPQRLINYFSKFATNLEACTSHFSQYAAVQCFSPEALDFTKNMVITLKERRDVLAEAVNRVPGFKCVAPEATFYLWANVTEAAKKLNIKTSDDFRKHILKETGVSVCARTHFGDILPGEKELFVRFAFSGINVEDIAKGLEALRVYFSGL